MSIFWIGIIACAGILIGYRLGRSMGHDWAPVARIRQLFPGVRENDDQNLKLLHDLLYARIGFTPLRVLSYTSIAVEQRAFRVEVFFGPNGQGAVMHLLMEQGIAIPIRVVRFAYSAVVDDWDLPGWAYLIDYLARGDVPPFYSGVTEYILENGEREFIEEFCIGNMENPERMAGSPLLLTCHDRWVAEQARRNESAIQNQQDQNTQQEMHEKPKQQNAPRRSGTRTKRRS